MGFPNVVTLQEALALARLQSATVSSRKGSTEAGQAGLPCT
jgi:hypothetical protein